MSERPLSPERIATVTTIGGVLIALGLVLLLASNGAGWVAGGIGLIGLGCTLLTPLIDASVPRKGEDGHASPTGDPASDDSVADLTRSVLSRADAVVRGYAERFVGWIDAGYLTVPESVAGWPREVISDCYLAIIIIESGNAKMQDQLRFMHATLSDVDPSSDAPVYHLTRFLELNAGGALAEETQENAAILSQLVIEWNERGGPLMQRRVDESARLFVLSDEAVKRATDVAYVAPIMQRLVQYAAQGVI